MPRPFQPPKAPYGSGWSIFWSDDERRFRGFVTLTRKGAKYRKKLSPGPVGQQTEPAYNLLAAERDRLLGAPKAGDGDSPLQTFLDAYATRSDLRPTTRDGYDSLVKNHCAEIGKIKIIDVTPADVKAALAAIESDRRRQQTRFLLRGTFKEAIFDGILSQNPVDRTRPVQYARVEKQRAYTPDQLDYLLAAAHEDPALEALVLVGLFGGLGPAEWCGLERRDIDLAHSKLEVHRDTVEAKDEEGKYSLVTGPVKAKGRERVVPLPPVVVTALREHLQRTGKLVMEGDGTEPVFTAPEGGRIWHRQFTKRAWGPLVKRAAKLAKKDGTSFPKLTPYALRHSFHEVLAIEGVENALISKLMGHTRPSTAYTHYDQPSEERLRSVADAAQRFANRRRKKAG